MQTLKDEIENKYSKGEIMTRFDIFLEEVAIQYFAKSHVNSGKAHRSSRPKYFFSNFALVDFRNLIVDLVVIAAATWYDQFDLA